MINAKLVGPLDLCRIKHDGLTLIVAQSGMGKSFGIKNCITDLLSEGKSVLVFHCILFEEIIDNEYRYFNRFDNFTSIKFGYDNGNLSKRISRLSKFDYVFVDEYDCFVNLLKLSKETCPIKILSNLCKGWPNKNIIVCCQNFPVLTLRINLSKRKLTSY